MGRRSGFVGLINSAARGAARAQRQAVAAHNRQVREYERAKRNAERDWARSQKEAAKEAKQQYLEDRLQETKDRNDDLSATIDELNAILLHTLEVDDTIGFGSLRLNESYKHPTVPPELAVQPPQPQKDVFYSRITSHRPVGIFEKLIHGKDGKAQRVPIHHEEQRKLAEQNYQNALASWTSAEQDRQTQLEELRERYERRRQAFLTKQTQRNAEVDEFEFAYRAGDPQAVETYNSMVLERSVYPDGFPENIRLAYKPESKEIVIDFELPDVNVVPADAEFKYVKARDAIDVRARKPSEIRSLYQDILASVALRTLHEVFEADQNNHLVAATFSGFVYTVDRTTGRDVRPYLISVRTTKDRFTELDLRRVDKKACLRNLGARVSSQPDECVAVKPVVDFNMVDRRFVDGSDVLSDLESRPNLMELSPLDFENLVGNLFSKMGLETRQTQLSRDGGVDVIAFDVRPILGGKVVIQAKRYSNTVGVSAVRDLYGTMMNEGATKGILVTTSGYGKAAFEFANDKPIELIDGGGLLYLLENHANVAARIIFIDAESD